MVAIDTCPVPRAHTCRKQPLEAGTAAEGLRKANLSHFSPETNGQVQQCLLIHQEGLSSQLQHLHPKCNPISPSTAFPFPGTSSPLVYSIFSLPLCLNKWGLSAVKWILLGNQLGWRHLLPERPTGDQFVCSWRAASPLHKWVSCKDSS